ncbi:MAG: proliferating cell nuclear antigen (pcna) [Candidatus Diapherotrites archaeon]|nr:proliferating cell nuclear antigen (pcna) [Candidatus Diapherotrites archaeon]
MFEITLPSAKMFKSCVDAIVILIDEGEIEIGEEGLKLRAMDPSQIAMVDFELPKSAFEKYEVKPTRIGLNLDDLAKVMARARPDEKLTMKLDESKARLVLLFKGKATRRFVIPLLDIGGTMPKKPQIEFESVVKFNGNFFKEALKDAQLVSSHVVLRTDPDAFIIEARGDKGEVTIRAEKNSDQIFDYDVKSNARAMFPLEYLNDLLKNADANTNVELSLRTDAPLRLEYKVGDASITYYLAPRIETT